MHMVGLAAELQQLAASFREPLAEWLVQVVDQLWRESLAMVLGHQNNVQPKLECSVR